MRHPIQAAWIVITTCGAVASAAIAQPRVIFEDRFTGALQPQWSAKKPIISATPAGNQKYLGAFGGESVLLNLTELPDHKLVRLSMDVLIIRSWDGNAPVQGPDIFYVFADDGRVLDATSFSWYGPQAYPGFFSVHTAGPGSGATITKKFGFMHENAPHDGIFHIECVFPHTGGKVGFRFLATTQSAISDEAWGITAARVSIEEPAALNPTSVAGAWDDLGSDDPAKAAAAVWKLVAGGDSTVLMLKEKLAGATIPADVELLQPTRGAARRLPAPGQDGYALDSAADRQTALAAHALQVIGSDAARQVLAGLQRAVPFNMNTLRVHVRDGDSSQPLPFIPIWIYLYGRTLHESVLTDSDGIATVDFPNDVSGEVLIQNARSVYVPMGIRLNAPNIPADLNLPIERAVPIGGMVVDDAGKPVDGANVLVSIGKAYEDPLIFRLGSMSLTTGADGKWSMDLGPGKMDSINIAVRDPTAPTEQASAMVNYTQKLAELREGKLAITLPKPAVIRGKVVDADTGQPIEKFRVSVSLLNRTGRAGSWLALPTEEAHGAFEVKVGANYDGLLIRIDGVGFLTAGSPLIQRADFDKEVEIKVFRSK